MEPIEVHKGTTGLNNKLDPTRLGQALASAVNVDIDDTGRVSMRRGNVLLEAGSYHSIFCDGGDCYIMKDIGGSASLFQVGTDYALTGVRSGLTEFARVSYAQVGDLIYYTNGTENGFLDSGVSAAWPAHSHVGPDTKRTFTGAPIGKHIACFAGRMWVAVDNILYYSEPFAYGKYNLAKCYFLFETDVKMIKSVDEGLFVSDSEKTWFLGGTNPAEMVQRRVDGVPAHEWSDAVGYASGNDFGKYELGQVAVWSSDSGLCLGLQNGTIFNVTTEKLLYPAGSTGACLIDKGVIINSIT